MGESYAETPVGNYNPRPHSVLGKIIQQQTIHKPTYFLTPRSRVLLEKLTGSAASQEIPRIFGTRRFLTVFISARHMSLS